MAPDDGYWMDQALALAALGDRRTSPNPRVGCVLVRDGTVVGRGFHVRAGEAHAEGVALAEAGDAARGATAYVSLEPCAHTGATPPCAGLLVDAGVRRVVVAMQDPDPRVNGRGFARLREAGIEVEVGLHADSAERVNAPFTAWQRQRRPLVSLKAAMSLDGKIAAKDGRSQWITNDAARTFAQRLRHEHDAVLVGAGTARADDPRLTVRVRRTASAPMRVVLSHALDLPEQLKLWNDHAATTRVYTSASRAAATQRLGAATVVGVAEGADGLDLRAVLDDLAAQGVRSIFVEGGARTHAAFVGAGLVDRVYLFVATKLIGAVGATPVFDLPAVSDPGASWTLAAPARIALGDDWLLAGRLIRPGEDG